MGFQLIDTCDLRFDGEDYEKGRFSSTTIAKWLNRKGRDYAKRVFVRHFAMNVMDAQTVEEEGRRMWRARASDHVVRCFGFTRSHWTSGLVLEHMNRGSLRDYVSGERRDLEHDVRLLVNLLQDVAE